MNAARQILLEALANDSDLKQLGGGDEQYEAYVEFEGPRTRGVLGFAIHKAFWQLFIEGIVAPGMNSDNEKFPWFHVTELGERVLAGEGAPVHDPDRYLERLESRVAQFDPTVRSYLAESLATYARGNLVAASVMLGIASERAFELLCETVSGSLSDAKEKAKFDKLLSKFAMKPKLDWLQAKFQEKSVRALPGFPDNANAAILAVYDFLRVQRNEFGHPKEAPPSVEREDVFSNLQVFARYYETVERVREVVTSNSL